LDLEGKSVSIQIIGYVSHTRRTDTSGLWWSEDFDIDYIEETARAHEEAGFDAILVGADSWGPDSWLIASHILRVTKKLKVLVAHRPGFVQPTVAARQAITLDRLSGGGRLALHIITGSAGGELQRDGDTLDPTLRYARSAEYMVLLRQIWTATAPFDVSGQFYQFKQGFSAIRPQHPLQLSFAGSSAEALDVGAQYADMYMLWGEPLAGIKETIDAVQTRSKAFNTTSPVFSVSLRAITAETEALAWDKAREIYETAQAQLGTANKADDQLKQGAFKLHSAGAQRLDAFANDSDVHDERLWLGFTRLVGRGGSTSALVGTVEQVTEAYMHYYDLGATALYLRGWDIATDATAYGQALIPALRAAAATRTTQ
jgi:alkanesulfonate monooxygenase